MLYRYIPCLGHLVSHTFGGCKNLGDFLGWKMRNEKKTTRFWVRLKKILYIFEHSQVKIVVKWIICQIFMNMMYGKEKHWIHIVQNLIYLNHVHMLTLTNFAVVRNLLDELLFVNDVSFDDSDRQWRNVFRKKHYHQTKHFLRRKGQFPKSCQILPFKYYLVKG